LVEKIAPFKGKCKLSNCGWLAIADIHSALSGNDAVAVARSRDAPSQKVGATPSSRDKPNTPFGWAAGVGDEASPTPSATGRRNYPHRRFTFQPHRSR